MTKPKTDAEKAAKQKCTAHSKQTGQPCGNWAVKGFQVCGFHGAGRPHRGRPGGRPIVHGRRSMRFRHLQEVGMARLEELASDPELLNLTRVVAASQLVLEESAPIDPDPSVLEAWAKAHITNGLTPAQADLDAARVALAVEAQRMLESHAKLQVHAHKAQAAADLVLEVAMPIMRGFAEDLLAILESEVGRDVAARVRQRFSQATAVAVGRIATAEQ